MRTIALLLIRLAVFTFRLANIMLPAKRFADQPFLGYARCGKCGEEWTVFSPKAGDIAPEAELVCPSCQCETARIV